MFSLESPHRGDTNEYTQYTIFIINEENQPKLSPICSYGTFSKGLENEFERAVVNELSVFEPLKVDCILSTGYTPFQILCNSTQIQSNLSPARHS